MTILFENIGSCTNVILRRNYEGHEYVVLENSLDIYPEIYILMVDPADVVNIATGEILGMEADDVRFRSTYTSVKGEILDEINRALTDVFTDYQTLPFEHHPEQMRVVPSPEAAEHYRASKKNTKTTK